MMKKEEDILEIVLLKRQGLSERQIAKRLGISRPTVNKYLNNPSLVFSRNHQRNRKSQLDEYSENIRLWIKEDPYYRASWIYDQLVSLGFSGSYEIVKRRVKLYKEEERKIAFMRFETEPGRQAQVDFGEFQVQNPDGTVKKYYLFMMILGYSRKIYGEFIEHCDLPTFLDCHIRAFLYFGGVPAEILYDRMKNVFIRKIAGRCEFNKTLTSFAIHYGFSPMVAPAYASWVKGKVERPYNFIREGFWRGYRFSCLEAAQKDLLEWLKKKEERVHGTTHEVVSKRFERESSYLSILPVEIFDTSYRIFRTVYKDCTIPFECNRYLLPHTLVGKEIILRVKDHTMRIYLEDQLIVSYSIPRDKGNLVKKDEFYQALRNDREMNRRKYGYSRYQKGRAKRTISPTKPLYDMEVQTRSIKIYYEDIAA